VGASPTRQPLQPEATGAAKEVTNWLKPSECVSRIGDSASGCGFSDQSHLTRVRHGWLKSGRLASGARIVVITSPFETRILAQLAAPGRVAGSLRTESEPRRNGRSNCRLAARKELAQLREAGKQMA